jgi:hypothetical protein
MRDVSIPMGLNQNAKGKGVRKKEVRREHWEGEAPRTIEERTFPN